MCFSLPQACPALYNSHILSIPPSSSSLSACTEFCHSCILLNFFSLTPTFSPLPCFTLFTLCLIIFIIIYHCHYSFSFNSSFSLHFSLSFLFPRFLSSLRLGFLFERRCRQKMAQNNHSLFHSLPHYDEGEAEGLKYIHTSGLFPRRLIFRH